MEDKKPVLNYRGSAPLKTISINQHIKQPMNTQLSIEDKVMLNGHSPNYNFTTQNHFEIIDVLEKNRIHHNIDEVQFSLMANYSRSCYHQLKMYQHRFSKNSYSRFRNLIYKLNYPTETKPVYQVSQPLPVYKPTPSNNVGLTEEMCINFLKATGKYKISKSEVTTNWVEL
jgi:hypothetical protein